MKTSNQASQPAGSDRDSMGEHESQPISFFTGRPIDPAYSATCPCCGAAVIPGEKCLSCGELAPQASIALHPSLTPEMPTGFAPEPVEQGEQTLDKDCKCCGYPCRGFLCDYCFRERLMDSFHQCKTKPSTTAPSEPKLPAMPDEITLPRHVMWAKLVELQQQLAQIKECKSERPEVYPDAELGSYCVPEQVYPLLDQQDAKIAALKLDNAQKAKRIAELEGGK